MLHNLEIRISHFLHPKSDFLLSMNHFLHKHRYWFLALILISVVALVYFQMRDDGGTVPNPPVPVGANP